MFWDMSDFAKGFWLGAGALTALFVVGRLARIV